MKKLLIALAILGLAVVVLLSFSGQKLMAEPMELPEKTAAPSSLPTPRPTAAPQQETETAPEEAPVPVATDYDAIYALHDPEEVVLTIDGREITWQDYFFAYYSQAYSTEQQFQMYQYYGMALGWQDQADEEGHTFAELVKPGAEEMLRQIVLVETLAEEKDLKLSEEDEQDLQEQHQMNIESYCGEGGTDEQLFEQLRERLYIRPEFYWRVMKHSVSIQALYRELGGEEGERFDEAQVLAWMEEQGIVSANHILIATMDLYTYQPLDEEARAEKEALARQIASELQAIEDPAEREKRFLELKEQYCEDGGDYVFGPGVMVPEFYDGTLALEEGQVSDPILSEFGYHIILRRPLHADDSIFTESGEQNVRSYMASESFSRLMQERYDAQVVEYAPGFEAPDILDYINRPVA